VFVDDPAEPSRKCGWGPQRIQFLVGLQKRFLSDVLSLVKITQAGAGVADGHILKPTHELRKRGNVARLGL